jgi:hypothetical protein
MVDHREYVVRPEWQSTVDIGSGQSSSKKGISRFWANFTKCVAMVGQFAF